MTTKYATTEFEGWGSGPQDGLFDTLDQLLEAQGWEQQIDGSWWQAGATQGCTREEALDYEDYREVRPFTIGTSGTVHMEYQTTIYASSRDDAYNLAKELPELVPLGDMNPDMPDTSDFDPWVKEA